MSDEVKEGSSTVERSAVKSSMAVIDSAIKTWLIANKSLALWVDATDGDSDLINIDGQFRISELAAAVYKDLDEVGFRFGEEKLNAN